MQITTTKEHLAAPLALVAGAADTRGTIPMLATVLLKATDTGSLSMICSDSGLLAKTLAQVDVKSGGEIAVDVRRINELIKTLPEKQPIELSLDKEPNTLLVKAGRSRFRLPTLPASDYPRMIPAKEERISITMGARRLAEMMGEISPSMGENDVRAFLNGALFSLTSTGLFLVSTDGHRMTVSHEPIAGIESITPRNVIVPRKTVMLARKLLGQGGSITLTLGAKNFQFTFEDRTVLFGNPIDGQFPSWRSVIPTATDQVTVSTDRLSASLAMLAAVPDDKVKQDVMKHKVEVIFAKATTTLRRGDTGLCEIDSDSSSDASHERAFNINYLIDAVDTVRSSSEQATIFFAPSATAISMRPTGKDYPLIVVMPLRA